MLNEPQTLEEMHSVWVAARRRIESAGLDFAREKRERDREVKERQQRLLAEHKAEMERRRREVMAEEAARLQADTDELRFCLGPRISVSWIIRAVCAEYKVSRLDLLSARRTQDVVLPRQVGMFLAKTLTMRSLPEISRMFGRHCHTTVINAVRKIERLLETDEALRDRVAALRQRLEAHVAQD